MNKQQIINAVAEKANLKKTDARNAVDAFVQVTQEALSGGDHVVLIGLGTISIGERAARVGSNPRTKERIQIPAKRVVKFRASNSLL